jgi:hypothetical protein
MTVNRRLVSHLRYEEDNQARWGGRTKCYRGNIYEIRIAGHLDKKWSEWLGGMEITHDEAGFTLLSGYILDQAALYGTMTKIRDLGLALISLNPQELGAEERICN